MGVGSKVVPARPSIIEAIRQLSRQQWGHGALLILRSLNSFSETYFLRAGRRFKFDSG